MSKYFKYNGFLLLFVFSLIGLSIISVNSYDFLKKELIMTFNIVSFLSIFTSILISFDTTFKIESIVSKINLFRRYSAILFCIWVSLLNNSLSIGITIYGFNGSVLETISIFLLIISNFVLLGILYALGSIGYNINRS